MVEELTGSKLRSWSWSFYPAATCACLQPLTKHWSNYAKAELKSTFCSFSTRLLSVVFVSQTFANNVWHGYARFKHICNVIIVMLVDVWHEQKHAWPLQEAWITRKRREKRKKWTQTEFLVFLSSLSLSLSLSLSYQYSSLLTQEKQRQSFSCVCLLTENKKPFFFTYNFTRSYITQILE